MTVKRARDSKAQDRDALCRLLAKIAQDTAGKYKDEYLKDLQAFISGQDLEKFWKLHDIETSTYTGTDGSSNLHIKVPEEFAKGGADTVVLKLTRRKPDLTFHIRDSAS